MYRAPPYRQEDTTTTPIQQNTIEASPQFQDLNSNLQILGEAISEFYSSSIDRFISNNRQQYSLAGGQGVKRTYGTVPGLDLHHQLNGGQEHIRLTAYPESINLAQLPLLLDLNFDGYIALVHNWQKLPPPGVDNAAIDVVVNGFGVLTNYTPDDDLLAIYQPALEPDPPAAEITQATVIIIIAFGGTALRCASLEDKLNTFVLAKGSGGSAAPIIPGRPPIAAVDNVPKHDDLLGYFVFNWGDQLNPDAWAYQGSQGTGPTFTYDANFPPPTIVKVIQFADPTKSPLVSSGMNFVYAQYTNTPAIGVGQNGVDFLCAEFFDRQQLRLVSQSWTYPIGTVSGVLVNDKPLYFACDGGSPFSDIGGKTNFGLKFDLTPAQSYPDAATFGFAEDGGITATPISADQQAAINANAAAQSAHGAAYDAALLALNAAQLALAIANENIYVPTRGSEWTLANAVARNPGPATAADLAGLVADVGQPGADQLVAYLTAELKFQANPSPANFTAFTTAFSLIDSGLQSLVEGDLIGIIADNSAVNFSTAYPTAYNAAIAAKQTVAEAQAAGEAAQASAQTSFNTDEETLISYATSIGQPALGAIAETDKGTLITAQNALIPLQQAVVVQTILSGGYQPINDFTYRTITFSGGDWTFGPYN